MALGYEGGRYVLTQLGWNFWWFTHAHAQEGKGGKGGGGVKDTYRNSKDVRSLKVPSSISNK